MKPPFNQEKITQLQDQPSELRIVSTQQRTSFVSCKVHDLAEELINKQ